MPLTSNDEFILVTTDWNSAIQQMAYQLDWRWADNIGSLTAVRLIFPSMFCATFVSTKLNNLNKRDYFEFTMCCRLVGGRNFNYWYLIITTVENCSWWKRFTNQYRFLEFLTQVENCKKHIFRNPGCVKKKTGNPKPTSLLFLSMSEQFCYRERECEQVLHYEKYSKDTNSTTPMVELQDLKIL